MSSTTTPACKVISAYQQIVLDLAQNRPTLQFLDDALFPDFKPKSLIEISGASNSGKSLLLWRLMSRCVPPTYFGGKYCDVLLIDMQHNFCASHFLQEVMRIVKASEQNYNDADIHNCLNSVTVLSCFSNDELELAYDAVEDLLWKNQNVALIAIDGLDAFYWLDADEKLLRMRSHYAKQVTKLRKLCEQHNVCCAYTVDANYLAAKSDADIEPPQSSSSKGTAPLPKIDYQLKLSLLEDGSRTLNEQRIDINDEKGLHLLQQQ